MLQTTPSQPDQNNFPSIEIDIMLAVTFPLHFCTQEILSVLGTQGVDMEFCG